MFRTLFSTLALLALGLTVALADEKKSDEKKTTDKTSSKDKDKTVSHHGRSLTDWIGDLQNDDELLREEAIEVLALLGTKAKPAVAELTKLFKHDNLAVRGRAAIAVWKITGETKTTLTPMTESLKSPVALIRREIVSTLAGMGEKATPAANAMVELLGDRDYNTRQAVSFALTRMGRSALPALLSVLKSKDVVLRRYIAAHLASTASGLIDKEELQAFKDRLEDEDSRVRIDCARLLWLKEQTDKPVLDVLAQGIKDNDTFVRSSILGTLSASRARPKALIPVLEPGLKADDLQFRVSCARLLFEVEKKPERVLPIYLAALKDGNVRNYWSTVIYALGELGPDGKDAIKPLIEAMKSKDFYYHYETRATMVKLGDAAVAPMLEILKDTSPNTTTSYALQEMAVAVLAQLGEKAAKSVAPLLTDKEPQIKQRALRVVVMMGPAAKDCVPKLVELLEDSDTKIRTQVFLALGNIGPDAKASISKLLELAKGEDRSARLASLRALARVQPEARIAVPLALEGLKGTDASVKAASLDLLFAVDPENKNLLGHALELLKETSTKSNAMMLLARLGTRAARAVPELIKILEDNNDYSRRQAADTLGAIGPDAKEAAEALAKQLERPDAQLQSSALTALKRLKPEVKTFLPQVIAFLKEPKNKTNYSVANAAMLLGDYESKAAEAGPALLALLKDQTVGFNRGVVAVALIQVNPALAKKEALPTLRSLMETDSSKMGYARAILMLDEEDKEANTIIENGLKAPSYDFRASTTQAVAGLGTRGKKFSARLRELLKDEQYTVRNSAAFALWKVTGETKDTLSILEASLQEEKQPYAAGSAAYYLGEMGPEAKSLFKAILPLRKAREPYTRSTADMALKKIDPEEAAKLGIK